MHEVTALMIWSGQTALYVHHDYNICPLWMTEASLNMIHQMRRWYSSILFITLTDAVIMHNLTNLLSVEWIYKSISSLFLSLVLLQPNNMKMNFFRFGYMFQLQWATCTHIILTLKLVVFLVQEHCWFTYVSGTFNYLCWVSPIGPFRSDMWRPILLSSLYKVVCYDVGVARHHSRDSVWVAGLHQRPSGGKPDEEDGCLWLWDWWTDLHQQ